MFYIKGIGESTWTKLPTPTKIDISHFDLSTAERAEDGTMYISFIAEKRRVDVTWAVLTDAQWMQILEAIRNRRPKFYIRIDKQTASPLEILVYAGDRKASLAFIRNNVRYWQDASIAFIEV